MASLEFDLLESRYNLPSGLLSAVMRAESGGNPLATSPKGAKGRFQLMPATSAELGIDPRNTTQDAEGAARLLSAHLRRYGSLPASLAAWNWGPGNIERKGIERAPAETRNFMGRVMNQLIPAAQAADTMNVRLPDGRLIRGVPKGTTKLQLAEKLKRNGFAVPGAWMQTAQPSAIRWVSGPRAAKQPSAIRWVSGPRASQNVPKLESPEMRKSYRQVQASASTPWSAVGAGAAENLLPSAVAAGKGIASGMYQLGRHPVESAQNLWQLAQHPGKIRDAVMQRYGSMENLKHSLMIDPAGVLLDASTLLGGVGALPKLGAVGKVARAIDPIAGAAKLTGKVVEKAVGPLAAKALGVTTSLGEEAPKAAWRRSPEFMAGMRGHEDQLAILDEAKDSVSQLKQQRGAAYRSELAKLKAAKTPIDPRRMVIRAARDLKEFGVEFPRDPATGQRVPSVAHVPRPLRAKVAAILKDYSGWTDFTPLGLDRLKRNLDSFYKAGEPEAALVSKLRNVVRSEIERQVPAYRKMTRDYAHASQVIEDIDKALSTREGANIDTALRKLGTLHRDVNWYRKSQLDRLGAATGRNLSDKIAGAQMHDILPRGQLSRFLGGTDIVGGALLGHPAVAAGAPLFSPRAVGETLSHVGPLYRGAKAVLPYDRLMFELSKMLQNPYADAIGPGAP